MNPCPCGPELEEAEEEEEEEEASSAFAAVVTRRDDDDDDDDDGVRDIARGLTRATEYAANIAVDMIARACAEREGGVVYAMRRAKSR